MKRSEKVIEAMSQIDDALLEESENYHARKFRIPVPMILTLTAAFFCIFFLQPKPKSNMTVYEEENMALSSEAATEEKEIEVYNTFDASPAEDAEEMVERFVKLEISREDGSLLEKEELDQEYERLEEEGLESFVITYGEYMHERVFLLSERKLTTGRPYTYQLIELYDKNGDNLTPDTEGIEIWEE